MNVVWRSGNIGKGGAYAFYLPAGEPTHTRDVYGLVLQVLLYQENVGEPNNLGSLLANRGTHQYS